MVNHFKVASLSHQNAPLEVRETFAFDEAQQKAVLVKIKDVFAISELLILSTCNRTELYFYSENDISADLIKTLAAEKGLIGHQIYLSYFQTQTGIEAVNRLFRVASGLDSKVVGDLQIPNQIKKSYQISADLDMAGVFLHRLMHSIFYTNKRIANETSFRDGTASVTYLATTLAEELTANIKTPQILVLGLGEIGLDVCKYLSDNTFGEVTVMTRTPQKAYDFAQNFNFKCAYLENLSEEIAKSDIVISSVRAEKPIISKAILKQKSISNYKYFIDLSVPRSVEIDVEDISGVLVYNIETLEAKTNKALEVRIEAIPQVEKIIEESIESFNDWNKEVMVSPTINKFKNALDTIRKEEMNRFLKSMTTEEADKVDKITQSIIQKIIKTPVVQLKAACKRGDAENMIELINELFDLEKTQLVHK